MEHQEGIHLGGMAVCPEDGNTFCGNIDKRQETYRGCHDSEGNFEKWKCCGRKDPNILAGAQRGRGTWPSLSRKSTTMALKTHSTTIPITHSRPGRTSEGKGSKD